MAENSNQRLQRLLRARSDERKLRALAREIGVAYSSVHRWMAGDAEPRPENWAILADKLGYTVDWLRGKDEGLSTAEGIILAVEQIEQELTKLRQRAHELRASSNGARHVRASTESLGTSTNDVKAGRC